MAAEEDVKLPDFNAVLHKTETGDREYRLTEAEKRTLLKKMNASHKTGWERQAEARRRWAKLDNYVEGRQVYDQSRKQYVGHEIAAAPSADDDVDAELFIFNTTRRIHSSNVQRLSSYSIQPAVVPNSSDPKDKEGARIGRICLADFFRKQGEKKTKRRIATIIDKYGVVFFKTYFDPTAGRLIHPVKLNDRGEMFVDEMTLEPEGEMVLKIISPRNVLIPRYTNDFNDLDELEEVHLATTDYVWRKWGIKVEPESIDWEDGYGPESSDLDQPDVEADDRQPQNSVVLKQRYINPCPEYQRGAIIVYTTKHILRCTDLLTYYDSLQDVWNSASAIESDKSPMGTSWLWDIIPVQDALNQDLTAIVNHIKMYGDLQWQVPATANIEEKKVSNRTGQGYQYTGEKGIDYLRPPELSQTHMAAFNLLNSLSMSLGAAHDISRSNRALSGNALATLQQIDDTVLRPCLESIGEALEKVASAVLKGIAENYTNERVMKMTSRTAWSIIHDFKGEMLNGNFDATINLMSGLSNNPIVRQESIYKALDKKVVDVPEARDYLEFGNSDDLLEEIQKEREIADRIVKGIADFPGNYVRNPATGGYVCKVVAHPWDNHELIIKQLIVYMRENYDTAEKPVKDELNAQLQLHQQYLAALKSPGMAPAPDQMTPEGGFGGAAPLGRPGLQKPESPLAGPDGFQAPKQQPDRAGIPQPAASGLTA